MTESTLADSWFSVPGGLIVQVWGAAIPVHPREDLIVVSPYGNEELRRSAWLLIALNCSLIVLASGLRERQLSWLQRMVCHQDHRPRSLLSFFSALALLLLNLVSGFVSFLFCIIPGEFFSPSSSCIDSSRKRRLDMYPIYLLKHPRPHHQCPFLRVFFDKECASRLVSVS